jgi:V/A-type H+-transporting ATPase subunit E
MSLEKLLEKIENDARAEGELIVARAEEEAARIMEEAEERARREGEAIARSFHARAESERMKLLSQARLEGRIELLAAKDELVEEVFREAKRSFLELPPERYRKWLKDIILKSVVGGGEELVASEHDRELLAAGLLEELNGELRARGSRGELKLAPETAPCERGVILRGDKTESNLSVEAALQRVRAQSEEEVSRILFAKAEG